MPDFHRNYLESLISKSVTAEDGLAVEIVSVKLKGAKIRSSFLVDTLGGFSGKVKIDAVEGSLSKPLGIKVEFLRKRKGQEVTYSLARHRLIQKQQI